MKIKWIHGVLVLLLLGVVGAAPPRVAMKWDGRDEAGRNLAIPDADRPSVLLFVRPEQAQSRMAVMQLQAALAGRGDDVRVIVVVSGRDGDGKARTFERSAGVDWPAVNDPDYELSGLAGVHVWPTTVLVTKTGEQAAHFAGLGKSFAADARAHVEHAVGTIDAAELARRLGSRQVVTEKHVAVRHLHVAQQLMERGQMDQARSELAEALKALPAEAPAQLLAVKLLAVAGEAGRAMELLDGIESSAAPLWQMNVLRIRVLIAQGEWERAAELLPAARRLNPDPGEVDYLEGLVLERQGKHAEAAGMFRRSVETAAPGYRITSEDVR